MRPGEQIRALVGREGTVTSVLGVPTGSAARIMSQLGVELGFVGTNITAGTITALPDRGVVSMTEAVTFGRYCAKAADFPLIIDGDTGFGGPHTVRRLIEECIDAGLGGIRLDDQPIESKRTTQDAGVQVVSVSEAIDRYGVAVQRRNELDPSFVIMAQCYARDAVNTDGLPETLERLVRYGSDAGVDWVQFECPHSVDEVRAARAAVTSTALSVMKGRMPAILSLDEHLEIGLNAAWYTFFPFRVIDAMCWESVSQFQSKGLEAWSEFCAAHPDNPFVAEASSASDAIRTIR